MEVKIGDIVKFISEKLEGKVTSLIDKNTVNVYCEEYGFEIPAATSDLVVIKSEFSENTTSQKAPTSPSSISVQAANTLYLAIVPENFQNLTDCRYDFHLINDTSQTCLYTIGFDDGEKCTGISAGNCNPDNTLLIGTYTLKEMDRIKNVYIQALFYQKGTYIPRKPIESRVKITPASFQKAGAYKHVRWFSNMALLRPLDKEQEQEPEEKFSAPEKLLLEKKQETPVRRPTAQPIPQVLEVDLHADQLLETTAGMENKDILEYQLDVFRKTLEEYKLRKGKKIVFIHGKGDGVLRQRILWELQTRYKRFHHQDASFKQYGYGATIVTIK